MDLVETLSRLGETVKTFRTEKNMTQRELAEAIGEAPGFIEQLEAGNKANATLIHMSDIAKTLGVTLPELCRGI